MNSAGVASWQSSAYFDHRIFLIGGCMEARRRSDDIELLLHCWYSKLVSQICNKNRLWNRRMQTMLTVVELLLVRRTTLIARKNLWRNAQHFSLYLPDLTSFLFAILLLDKICVSSGERLADVLLPTLMRFCCRSSSRYLNIKTLARESVLR